MNIIIRFIKVKSNLNISMAKKINTYSWIHELNAAAMKAKLLSESKIYSKQIQLNESNGGPLSDITKGLHKQYPKDIKIRPGDENLTSDQIKAKIAAEKQAIGTMHKLDPQAMMAINRALGGTNPVKKDLQVTDVDGDGDADAFDVEADGSDNVMGAIDPSMMARYPSLQRGIGVGREEELSAEAQDYEMRDWERRESGYTGRQGERP
jgi:hypothetical protein